nr:MAG TPA: hypothetical protein [Caudoviricetes sp.]
MHRAAQKNRQIRTHAYRISLPAQTGSRGAGQTYLYRKWENATTVV